MNFWFTADYHLGHANIIKYCNRPFNNVDHMNSTIIRNHNSRVKPEDVVFFLGDFCFKGTSGSKVGEGGPDVASIYLEKLNGHFVFIKGNHDNNNSLKSIIKEAVIELGGHELFLVHDPADASPEYDINLHGHVHGKWKIKRCNYSSPDPFSKAYKRRPILINVGVDVWNFMPVSISEILKELARWKRYGSIINPTDIDKELDSIEKGRKKFKECADKILRPL